MANQIELHLDPALFAESEWLIESAAAGGSALIDVNTHLPTMRSDWDGKSFRATPLNCRNHEGAPIDSIVRYFDFICDEHSVQLTAVYKENHAPHPDPVNWPIKWDKQEPLRVNHFVFTDLGPSKRPLKIDVTMYFISTTEKRLSIKLVG